MSNLIRKFERGIVCFFVGFGLLSGPSWALTPDEIAAAKNAAQTEGMGYGNAVRTGSTTTDPRTGAKTTLSTVKPDALINAGSTVGANNAWGTQYTGTVPASLTDKSTSTSLISVGNTARTTSVTGFTGYNSNRQDQANQSNYFLSRGPVVKPTISQTEPWLTSATASISSSAIDPRVCQPIPAADTPQKVSDNTCQETYNPYIVPCTSQGTGVSFELIPAPVTAATISSYSCPASSGNTTVVLSGSSCVSTTTTLSSATTNYTCPTGAVRSGTQCTLTTTSTYPAQVNYSCAAGTTLNGTSCVKTTTTTQPPITNYGCSTGQVLSGTNCVSTANQSATTNYYCPVGTGYLSGSTCVLTNTYVATPNYACSAGATLNGTSCTTTVPVLQTTCNIGQTYTLNMTNTSGMDGDSCQGGDRVWAEWVCTGAENPAITMYTNSKPLGTVGGGVPNYGEAIVNIDGTCMARFTNTTVCAGGTCNGTYIMQIGSYDGCSGGTYFPSSNLCLGASGVYSPSPIKVFNEKSYGSASRITASGTFQTATTVNQVTNVPATLSYSCPQGGTLSGTTCSSNAYTPASIAYTCPTNYTLSGTTCSSTSTTPATQTYSCNPGYTYNGSVCTQSTTSSTLATVSYSCPSGGVLSGTTCNVTNVATTIATVSYSCPVGAVLSGSTCTTTTVTTAAAKVNYSCPTGYTLSGTQCTGTASDKLVETSSNGCGPLEGLAN